MSTDLRNEHLRRVLESMLRYHDGGGALSFHSEHEQDGLAVKFLVHDAAELDRIVSAATAEAQGAKVGG